MFEAVLFRGDGEMSDTGLDCHTSTALCYVYDETLVSTRVIGCGIDRIFMAVGWQGRTGRASQRKIAKDLRGAGPIVYSVCV
jgi:hypothetical protein